MSHDKALYKSTDLLLLHFRWSVLVDTNDDEPVYKIIKQNWIQFLFAVKPTILNLHVSKFLSSNSTHRC